MNRRNNNKGKRKKNPLPGEDTYYESSIPSTTTIHVSNIPPTLFQHNVTNMFQEYGRLRSVNVDPNNNRGRIALVEFENRHDAENAFNRYNNAIVQYHYLKLKWYTRLLSDEEVAVDIIVGDEEDEEETFKAHPTILKSRSLYFNIALLENRAVFLIYIKIDGSEKYLINEKNKWFHQNLNYVYKISSKHQLFEENPASILKSNYLVIIEKSMLTSILERDGLTLDEIDIWNYAIRWRIGQNEALEKIHFRME